MANIGDYNDLSSLQHLRTQAAQDPEQAVSEVARQFEGLFISMMLKSMRDTVPQDTLFGSNSMDSYQNMFDQQISLNLSSRGGVGLADIIEKQLLAASRLAAESGS